MTTVELGASPVSVGSLPRRVTDCIGGYVALTKPRIIELLLVTTVPSMVLAAGRWPSWRLLAVTLVGGTLAAGSANSLNCYLDRDIDALMNRTSGRPLVTNSVPPARALVFGLVLGVVAGATLWWGANALSSMLALAAIVFYVLGYTWGLKRRTSQNIVWGGAAGCAPVLVGWAAVTGTLSWAPVVLFLVVFLWTPPHFWALAMRFKDDYARAGVPMLPVVATEVEVSRQIVAYTVATVIASLALWPIAHTGWLYPIAAAGLGGLFLRDALRLHSDVVGGRTARAPQLFHRSISYLSLLFVGLAVDILVLR